MRATPSITPVGTWTVNNCSQPLVTIEQPNSTQTFHLYATVTVTGDAYFVTTATSMYITASAEL